MGIQQVLGASLMAKMTPKHTFTAAMMWPPKVINDPPPPLLAALNIKLVNNILVALRPTSNRDIRVFLLQK